MTTGYVCSVCRTPVTDLSAMACTNCAVDFGKVGPATVSDSSLPPAAHAPAPPPREILNCRYLPSTTRHGQPVRGCAATGVSSSG
jgi:hypothetical protein